ncbi:MAG TPA: type I 3-dehydroquinate dehydratase [Acidobacteriota bacterium]|nr:type I 3-dehydroquinate dehydratase [Acidobacteriota bacterium]HNR37788.1 type I 3-dehydroquinate dehydratase [Acidobacteriota bacterium]HNT99215.1 type I 3-dehydroquinate dehydratase [Acidobacteriota bacterium]HPB29298.1 type I 3-dehydroquinate dehydratase [Acidobacteriota bacterium]HQO25683.1 type I 3-dehydroquinate dehydratase [Acidobacteriota bacterium]
MTSLTLSGSSSLKPDGGARPPAPLSAFELRLDLHPGAALPPAGDLPTIYTCRRPQDGGRFAGSEVERAAALRRALAACRPDDRIDIEWDSDFRDWPRRHPDIGFIVSYHNLSVTPPDLDGLLTRMAAEPAREYKIITAARTWRDIVAIKRLLADARRRAIPLTAYCSGPLGPVSRLLALAWGTGRLYLAAGTPLVSGMLTAEEFFKVYRAQRVTVGSRLYGVAGYPVERSLSPCLHNWLFESRSSPDLYLPLPVPDPDDFLAALPELDITGLSVTVPLKEQLRGLCVSCSAEATRIRAVNTLTRGDGGWHGDNTDWSGFRDGAAGFLPAAGPVLVLGAGGSARAVMYALELAGIKPFVWNRGRERLERLLADYPAVRPWSASRALTVQAVINTLPHDAVVGLDEAGLGGHPPVPVFDLNYGFPASHILSNAAARHWPVRDGLSMLYHQARAQHRRWTGGDPPVSWGQARKLLLQAVRERSSDGEPSPGGDA